MYNVILMNATKLFFNEFNWTDPVAVTLTFKKGIMKDGRLILASDGDYRQNVHHFLNVLNQKIYKGFSRKGWLMSVGAVRETGAFERPHHHLILNKPPHLTFEQYAALIHRVWNKTMWGHRNIEVMPDGSERWINYMTKLRSKETYADAIDWTNTHNAMTPLSEIYLPMRLRMPSADDNLLKLAAEVVNAQA